MTDIIQEETPIEEKKENKETENEALKSFLGEDAKETDKDTPAEENPKEEPVLEPEKPKQTEVPLDEIVEEVKNKTKEEVKSEILKALGMTQEEKKEAEDAGYKTPWEKRGEDAPKNWTELIEASSEYQEFKKVENEKALNERQRQELVETKEREAEINTEWDSQLNYLRAEGLIPAVDASIQKKLNEGKMLTTQEREDPGLKAQVNLFESMYNLAQERELVGQAPVTDLIHIYSRYYKPTQKPKGAQAPVSGGSTPVSKPEEEDLPYEQLHNARGFEDLVK